MRLLSMATVLLGLAASVYAAPKPATKPACNMDPKACAAACAKVMKANGIKGTCTPEMCKTGKCPLKAKGIKCPMAAECAKAGCDPAKMKAGQCPAMGKTAKGKAACPAGAKACPMAKK